MEVSATMWRKRTSRRPSWFGSPLRWPSSLTCFRLLLLVSRRSSRLSPLHHTMFSSGGQNSPCAVTMEWALPWCLLFLISLFPAVPRTIVPPPSLSYACSRCTLILCSRCQLPRRLILSCFATPPSPLPLPRSSQRLVSSVLLPAGSARAWQRWSKLAEIIQWRSTCESLWRLSEAGRGNKRNSF